MHLFIGRTREQVPCKGIIQTDPKKTNKQNGVLRLWRSFKKNSTGGPLSYGQIDYTENSIFISFQKSTTFNFREKFLTKMGIQGMTSGGAPVPY